MAMLRRRLYLGSVSSLSFEEEESLDSCFFASSSSDTSLSSINNNNFTDGRLKCHGQLHDHEFRGHELHELLTERLEEQVDFLIRVSFSNEHLCTTIGLRQTLRHVVHDVLRMSEEEPYGVKGATIFLKMKSCKGDLKSLGLINVDTNTASTFNLTLILEEEKNLGVCIKNWLGQFFSSCKQAHVISPQYLLKKEKLYRSESGSSLARLSF